MCCFLWMCSTARKKYSQLQNRFITFPASQSSVGFVSSSPDCLFSSGRQHEKHTHSHRLSFRETLEMFFFFFPPLSKGTDTDYLLVWQLQLAAAMDGIIRQIPTVERRSVSSPGDIQQNPSRATWETLFPGLIWLKRCSRDISSETQGRFIMAALFFFSFLLSFLSSRLRFIKLTVTQCALSLGAIPIYSPHHHCRPRRPQTLSAASHQPSAHYPSHRRMLGQY